MSLQSSAKAIMDVTDPMRSYWSVILSTGSEINERSVLWDFRKGGLRPIDWSLDLVSTSDILKIKEVTLNCPDGQKATLQIEESGTCFQLKIASMSILTGGSQVQAHIIGKVTDKVSGSCLCNIWDRELGLISFTSSVYDFGSWRDGVLPLKALNLDVLGLRL